MMETGADMNVGFIGIILLVLLAGVVVLLVKGGRTGRWIAGAGGVVLLLLILLFPVAVRTSRVNVQSEIDISGPVASGSIWQVTMEDPFEADVYPSMHQAAQALGKKVGSRLAEVTANKEPATEVLICFSEKFDARLGNDIREGIISVKHISNIRVSSSRIPSEQWPHKENPQAVTLNLGWNFHTAKGPIWPNENKEYWEGTLRLNAIGQGGEFGEEVRFIDKPWVSDYSGFVNRQPQQNWLIAQSQKPCTSAEEAHQQAIKHTAQQLSKLVFAKVKRYSKGFLSRRSEWTHPKLQTFIESELRTGYGKIHGQVIRDRFLQSFDRPYGATLWREALLVDATGYNLDKLARKCAGIERAEQESWLKIVLSAVGMLGIVCVVYVFLNSATKGYYTASLRVAAVVLAMVIIGIAMVLA